MFAELPRGKNQTKPKPNGASAVQSVRDRDRDNLLSQSPTGYGLSSFRCENAPRTVPGRLQGGQRGSATRGDTAEARGDLVRLCLEENSPASPAARDKVGVCCPPPPPASRQGSGGTGAAHRRSRGRRIFPFPKGSRGLPVAGPPRKVVPGRASRVGRRCRTRVRSQHPADTHGLCFGYFSRRERLGRALLRCSLPCSPHLPAQHPCRGSLAEAGFQARCSGLGDVSVT